MATQGQPPTAIRILSARRLPTPAAKPADRPSSGASTLDRYSAAAATRGDSVPAGIMADRGSGAGNFAPGSSVPLTGNRYGMPGSTPSSTGSSSYPLSAAADSSAMSSGSAALQSSSPASMGNGAVSTPEYRPGGTGDYLPRGVVTPTSATLPSSASTVKPARRVTASRPASNSGRPGPSHAGPLPWRKATG